MKSWRELLTRPPAYTGQEFGPEGAGVASALWAIKETPWFSKVGEPLPVDRVVRVQSWEDALTIFDDKSGEKYNINGHLIAAHKRCSDVLDARPELEVWRQAAQSKARKVATYPGAPKHLPQERRDLVFEYLWELVSMLMAEVIVAPYVDCTYFREQCAWFHEGRLPCGWEGDWPVGMMRVL